MPGQTNVRVGCSIILWNPTLPHTVLKDHSRMTRHAGDSPSPRHTRMSQPPNQQGSQRRRQTLGLRGGRDAIVARQFSSRGIEWDRFSSQLTRSSATHAFTRTSQRKKATPSLLLLDSNLAHALTWRLSPMPIAPPEVSAAYQDATLVSMVFGVIRRVAMFFHPAQ